MNKLAKKIVVFILVISAGAMALRLLAQTCVTARKTFTEDFYSKTKIIPDPVDPSKSIEVQAYRDYRDLMTTIYGWPSAPIELPRKGANFMMTSPGGLGGRIYSCDSGDFNADGYPDLIGLDIWRQQQGQSNPESTLVFIQNNYATAHAANFTITASQVDAQHRKGFETFNTNTAPASIAVGEFNGDGKLDFFFMRNSVDEFGYTNFLAAMYINTGTLTSPNFSAHNVSPSLDFTAKFKTAGIYANWAANHLCAVDIDGDGDTDVLVASQDKIFLVRNPGAAQAGDINKWSVSELNYNRRDGFTGTLGGSAISAADFDKDGDIDIIVSTVNKEFKYLAYYENDHGNFVRSDIAIPAAYAATCCSVVGISTKDFDNDGWPDVFAAGDSAYSGNPPAHMWMLLNQGLVDVTVTGPDGNPETVKQVSWEFQCLNGCAAIIPGSNDVDMLTPMDYDKDGDYDVIVADANDSGDYYLVINMLADIFTLKGQATSTNIGLDGLIPLDERRHAVTRIRLASLNQTWRGKSNAGLEVKLYFSADGGTNWELYVPDNTSEHKGDWIGSEIKPVSFASDAGWYSLKHFGADLRWQLLLTAPEDAMTDPTGVPITGASFDTPSISSLTVEYEYVLRQEYSRASAAASIVKKGQKQNLIVGSSFIYPGWEGQLRGYDVTDIALTGGSFSALSTVTTSDLTSPTGRTVESGTTIAWDAGELLNARDPADRTIYTAIRKGKNLGNKLERTDFSSTNADLVNKTFLSDTQNDDAGLINFIRGVARDWKLGDINHSSPVIVGPPSGTPALMGNSYDQFLEDNKDRTKVLYVGANDGMLHCFDVATGAELWGFIPYNLLPKLTSTWKVATNTSRYYVHDTFVDGSPVVGDVYITVGGVQQWRTVLICGQGPGKGTTIDSGFANGVNYYWALDVTDPMDPIPLWEITHRNTSNQVTMGETWSVPAIGQVNVSGTPAWVAFMGSGYNNIGQSTAGRTFYVVRIDSGQIVRTVTVADVDTNNNTVMSSASGRRPYKYTNIPDAIVASPTALDSDNDGMTEAVYVGDLDGRLYKMDVTNANPSSWTLAAIYTDFLYYPIITKPAVWMDPFATSPTPRISFGTGGDEGAPSDRQYSFVGLIDNGTSSATVEWYIGDRTVLKLPAASQAGDKVNGLGAGYKVWADPIVADYTLYFSTLFGSIEAVNPCANLAGAGFLYARIIRPGSAGNPVGGTALKTADAVPPENMQMASKARRAVTVGDTGQEAGVNKREVYIQEYNSTIEMLEHPIGSLLQIKSWREIYRIIR